MSASLPENPIESEFEKLKIGTEPKPVEFCDLNDDAIGLIIDELDLKERLILRKVSRGLRTLVDQKKSILKRLGVTCKADHIRIWYDGKGVIYTHEKYDSNPFPGLTDFYSYRQPKGIRTENYPKAALDDLQYFIKDPTLQLDVLDVDYYLHDHNGKKIFSHCETFFGELENILKSLNHKVSTKKLIITPDFINIIMAILPFLKSGTLESIRFEVSIEGEKLGIDQIANLEQWKQATELTLRLPFKMWSEQHLLHFKRFWINDKRLNLDDVFKWKDFFSRSSNFEYGYIQSDSGYDPEDIQNHLGDIVSTDDDDGDPMYIIHHPMATDSNQIMEIKVKPGFNCVEFTKIARPSC